MKKRILLWSVLSVLAIYIPMHSAAQTPAAILLSCRGNVVVIKGSGESVNGSYGLPLAPGDEVRTGEDAEAEIHFENGSWLQIGASSKMKVKGARTEKATLSTVKGKESFKAVQRFLSLKNPEGASSMAALRSVNKSLELRVESPCKTKIRGSRPVFRWSASDPSAELRLTLYNEEGIHWRQNVKDTETLPYPAAAPPLVPGTTYSWTLETTDPLRFPPLRSKAAYFEILSPEEGETLKTSLEGIDREKLPSESAYHLVRASLFFNKGLMEDAIGETMKALEADPGNNTLHSILARLYAEAGLTEEAINQYDRLLEKR
jgi:tetratricopeptide (TPR) repeat protein